MTDERHDTDKTIPDEEGDDPRAADAEGPAVAVAEKEAKQETLSPEFPRQIGRYRIDRVLGEGAYGVVYLAYDDQLQRPVAVKVPHRHLTPQAADAAAYLAEARTLAGLDHPQIVPVHDVGSSDTCPCFIVSKYIDGTSLAVRMEQATLSYTEAAELTATIAEALHYAHKRGLVHRDVKPGNILLDSLGKPYVADFGLALKEADLGTGPQYAGTPAYMSPEQARGEGHRVDGRSDIYSLGAVLYRLLTGRRTFTADTTPQLLALIATQDPKPPRQIDDRIPKELERICLKALARRASDRYTTGKDMADDLRHFLASGQAVSAAPSAPAQMQQAPGAESTASRADSDTAGSDKRPMRIVPKGLRSFDEHDADFFLELLPGPRDREGLPDSIRFWKTRIEESDPDKTFAIGLIYGPSGCGKSSLVKAGLLPRLSRDVIAVYVEATGQDTELRLLNALRRRCPGLPADLDLKQTLTALRRGHGVPLGKKVLIVLDQFEQWLHARAGEEDGAVIEALRQCDGCQVQCIVMVRDDFWMAATRFMRELEIPLVEGHNSAAVDLFPLRHAQRVLAAFGRAFGTLPEKPGDASADQQQFVQQAVAGLAEEGKVISVRLALLAEMMKGRPWVPSELKQVGGTEGVGVTFLEETFSASTSPPEHRYHQKAARAVLKALLPESGTNIRGHMRSYEELLDASGYAHSPADFARLLNILDSELRLITPTDPAGVATSEEGNLLPLPPGEGRGEGAKQRSARVSDPAEPPTAGLPDTPAAISKSYQLTHDYLVPSLRQWLTRKQKETRRGRAELRLAERAALWSAKPENRHLPSWWEYLNIRLSTSKTNWNESQRRMMRTAGSIHGLRWGTLLVFLVATSAALRAYMVRIHGKRAESLVAALIAGPADAVPDAIQNLEDVREYAIPLLKNRFAEEKGGVGSTGTRRAACALAAFGQVHFRAGQHGFDVMDFLLDDVGVAPGGECANIVSALGHAKNAAVNAMRREPFISSFGLQDLPLKARKAVVCLHLGDASVACDMFQLRTNPTQRTVLIDTFASWYGDAAKLAILSAQIDDASFRSGICLAIGGISEQVARVNSAEGWYPLMLEWYEAQPDTGTHSAAAWALGRLMIALPDIPPSREPVSGYEWYVNSLGMTMLRIPAGKFLPWGGGVGRLPQHVELTRPFFLSDREVSVGLFGKFVGDAAYRGEKPKDWPGPDLELPSDDHPVNNVSWEDAVSFCNWISHKEGLTPYYARKASQWEVARDATGYRLPSEAQWIHACRAGTETEYAWGEDWSDWGEDLSSLAKKYAVAGGLGPEPCGSKMPNGWGLFDMHGNVQEWCKDWFQDDPYFLPSEEPATPPQATDRVIQGGSFKLLHGFRPTPRWHANPQFRDKTLGFRVARFVQPQHRAPISTVASTSDAETTKGDAVAKPSHIASDDPFAKDAAKVDTVKDGLTKLRGKLIAMGQRSSWSPDGLSIAFGRGEADGGIQVLNISTRKTAYASIGGKDPVWLGGVDQKIALVRETPAWEELWVVGASGANPRRIALGGFPSCSADGQTLFYFSADPFDPIYLMAISVDEAASSPKKLVAVPYRYPAVSSDGKRMAYKSSSELVIVELESGKAVKRWGLPKGNGFLGGWSPDNRQLGFGGFGEGDPMPCVILDVDTGKAVQVAPRYLTLPAWSPDGAKITFDLRLDKESEIWLFEASALKDLPTTQLLALPVSEEEKQP